MIAQGTFDITMHPEPPYDTADGIALGRIRIDKRFHGALEATSVVHMTSARTPVANSAGYVAIERVQGTLDGKEGSFILQHHGIMTRGAPTLSVVVVPDSATGALAGLAGQMTIDIIEGVHRYTLTYELRPST